MATSWARRSRNPIQAQLESGRRPSFDSAGNVRGFRSRPGATTAEADIRNAGASPLGTEGGFSNDQTWANFFRNTNEQQAQKPVGVSGGADRAEAMALPNLIPSSTASAVDLAPMVRPTAQGYRDMAIASGEKWTEGWGRRSVQSQYGTGSARFPTPPLASGALNFNGSNASTAIPSGEFTADGGGTIGATTRTAAASSALGGTQPTGANWASSPSMGGVDPSAYTPDPYFTTPGAVMPDYMTKLSKLASPDNSINFLD